MERQEKVAARYETVEREENLVALYKVLDLVLLMAKRMERKMIWRLIWSNGGPVRVPLDTEVYAWTIVMVDMWQ